jgi:hypothetical protein
LSRIHAAVLHGFCGTASTHTGVGGAGIFVVALVISRATVGDGLEAAGVVNTAVGGAFGAIKTFVVGEAAPKDQATEAGIGVADIFRTHVIIVTLFVLFTTIREEQSEAL